MRKTTSLCAILLGLLLLTVHAEDVPFDNGGVSIHWSTDGQFVTILSTTDVAPAEGESHVWILTVYSHRFSDGLFAWQLHYSEGMDSVLVLPNDFLTARHFTTEQLGIEATLSDTGDRLSLRVPTQGTIPNLITAGDQIEIHALWIQQPSLVSLTIPIPGALATALPSGGAGGAVDNQDLENSPSPAIDAVSDPDSDVESLSTSLVPDTTSYVQGEPLAHCFAPAKQLSSDGPNRIVLSYTLFRLHDDQATEFVRFAPVSYDFDTGTYAYTINTDNLKPGHYRLLIDSSNSDLSARMEFWLVSPVE